MKGTRDRRAPACTGARSWNPKRRLLNLFPAIYPPRKPRRFLTNPSPTARWRLVFTEKSSLSAFHHAGRRSIRGALFVNFPSHSWLMMAGRVNRGRKYFQGVSAGREADLRGGTEIARGH